MILFKWKIPLLLKILHINNYIDSGDYKTALLFNEAVL